MLVSIIDHSISLISGIISVLLGFRLIGPKYGTNQKYDALYSKWIKHLKWLGPLVILFAAAQIAIKVIEGKAPQTGNSYKAELRKNVEKSISENGTLAVNDRVFESEEGFSILIPAGYTYSKPPNTNIGLIAIRNPDTTATSTIIVAVETSNRSGKDFIEGVKQSLQKNKDKTHKFSETKSLKNGATTVLRINDTVLRSDGLVMRGVLLFAEKNGKQYMANLGVREEQHAAYEGELERVVASFELR